MWTLPIVLSLFRPSLTPLYFDYAGHSTGDIFLQFFFLLHTETPSWIVLFDLGALLACDQSQQTDRKEGNIAELSSWVCFNLAIFLIHNAFVHIFPIYEHDIVNTTAIFIKRYTVLPHLCSRCIVPQPVSPPYLAVFHHSETTHIIHDCKSGLCILHAHNDSVPTICVCVLA